MLPGARPICKPGRAPTRRRLHQTSGTRLCSPGQRRGALSGTQSLVPLDGSQSDADVRLLRLDGKTAFVTGGGQGIGGAAACRRRGRRQRRRGLCASLMIGGPAWLVTSARPTSIPRWTIREHFGPVDSKPNQVSPARQASSGDGLAGGRSRRQCPGTVIPCGPSSAYGAERLNVNTRRRLARSKLTLGSLPGKRRSCFTKSLAKELVQQGDIIVNRRPRRHPNSDSRHGPAGDDDMLSIDGTNRHGGGRGPRPLLVPSGFQTTGQCYDISGAGRRTDVHGVGWTEL